MNNLNLIYFSAFVSSFILTICLVPIVRWLALKCKIIDKPAADRKIHSQPTPLLGGLAIFCSSFFVLAIFRFFHLANFSRVPDHFLWGIFWAACLIMLGGFWDDKYNLRPWQQIIWPLMAVLVVLFSGIKITFITNPVYTPTNAIIYLSPLLGAGLAFFWLLGMMYTTKFLDGLYGLLSGVAAIAALMIFLLSLDWDVANSATGAWALIIAGSALGFLLFNWYPAKIFLGEGGSIFLGFILGVLSIISGSKIATTLLVMGIPALDVFWVIVHRWLRGESPFSHADRKHLHFRLLTLGFSSRGAVLFLYLVSLIFGWLAIFSQGFGKLFGLGLVILLMSFLSLLIYFKNKQHA